MDCEMFEKSIKETVVQSSRLVKKELMEPEEQQPKHVIQSHETKPQDGYNKLEIMTSSRNKPLLIVQSKPITETLHKCDHCSYATDSEENLQKHAKIHYVCVYCKHIAASEVSLLLHVSKHASGKPKTYARRSYPGKRQNPDAQSGLYRHGVTEGDTLASHRKHEVKAERGSDVSTQAGYVECKVQQEREVTRDACTATTLALKVVEGPEEFEKLKQHLLRLKVVIKSKVGTREKADMCTEHEAGNEPVEAQADPIKPEVKQEPGSEMGLQASMQQEVLEEWGTACEEAALASPYTKQQVKEEPVNESGSMEHAVKEECISETTQADVQSEDIQAPHLKKVSERATELDVEEAACGVSAAAARAGLYPGHVVKGELVLGPEELSTHKQLVTLSTKQEYQSEEPATKSVTNKNSLILHSAPVTEKSHKCNESLDNEKPHSKKKISYKCAFCSFVSASIKDLQTHQTMHIGDEPNTLKTHSLEKPYNCAHCPYGTADKRCLKSHVKKHAQWKPYKCVHCSYVCAYKSQLKVHENIHAGKESQFSMMFGYACYSKTAHTVENVYRCDRCSFATAHEQSLKVHARIHTGEKPYKCTHCNIAYAVSSSLRAHLKTHTEGKQKCAYCSFETGNKTYLRYHERTHTAGKVYKCDRCSFATAHEQSLKVHARIHTGEKPYKCAQCDYSFTRQKSLKFHETWTHTDKEPYKCNSCSYTTKYKHMLNSHAVKSHGGKPYKCAYCNFASAYKKSVIFHERKHTGENLYECAYCGHTCARISELNYHEKTHSKEKTYRCAHCSYASALKSYVRDHLKRYSGDKSHIL